MDNKIVNKKFYKSSNKLVISLIIILAIMEITAFPLGLFVNVRVKDVNPIYITLMGNYTLAILICIIYKKFFIKDWKFCLVNKNFYKEFKKYFISSTLATMIVAASFYLELSPLNKEASLLKLVIEGIVFYIFVAIIEEIYLRALLQNLLIKVFKNRKDNVILAIIISSVIFGLGHIVSGIGQTFVTMISKVIWATFLGIYFGAVYYKSKDLKVVIVLHFLINLCGIPFIYSSSNKYPIVSTLVCLITYSSLGIYGLKLLKNK